MKRLLLSLILLWVNPVNAVDEFDWWSLKPLNRPAVPPAINWAHTPINRFVAAKHQEMGLKPAAPADRRTLIRRVYYDLIGLPPKPNEVEVFVCK